VDEQEFQSSYKQDNIDVAELSENEADADAMHAFDFNGLSFCLLRTWFCHFDYI
jgi:hypothetical protein